MRPVAPSLPAGDDLGARRLVLRDGTVAGIRPASRADLANMHAFYEDLSQESRYRRFLSMAVPSDQTIEALCDSADPTRRFTMIAERSIDGRLQIVAAASYVAIAPDSAEAAFAVADRFQGRGLGTALLERLAVVAARSGFRTFQATTLSDNTRMLEVFRDSGFEIRSKSGAGCIDVQLSLTPSTESVAAEEARNRAATAASLRPLLEPHAVAVIGASRNPQNIGRRVLDALTAAGFAGSVYAVNPKGDLPGIATFRSARDLPAGVDLAVVAVPAAAILATVDECAAAGVRSLVVITAGFAETGAAGRALQDRLTEKVRGYGMRMIGPNCMGIINARASLRLNASFSPIVPPEGRVGLLSQSGALGLAILRLAGERELGLSSFVSAGNKADVSGNDLLEYWEEDPGTDVILLYLESFGNPRRFARLARRISRHKPIVVVKSGRTRAGSRAAGSHTAALAASDTAVDALFRQSGVIRADTIDELFDVAACLDAQPLPAGSRVAIVTNAGGPGILTADACEASGLTLTELSDETRARVSAALPGIAGCTNPIDMIASAGPEQYRRTIETIIAAPEVDSLIVIFTPVDPNANRDVVAAIGEGVAAGRRAGGSAKPVVTCVMSGSGHPRPIDAGDERLPAYAFPENAARALGKITGYARWRSQPPGLLWGFDDLNVPEARRICREALDNRGDTWLRDEDVFRVLGASGFPLAPGAIARSANEASALASVIGFPVVAKLSARGGQHKTELGGVRLNLATPEDIGRAYAEIVDAARKVLPRDAVEGVLIQPMIRGSVETMIGVTQDPLFGPLVAFGLGGIHVEVLGDVCFRIAPLTDRDVEEQLHAIKGFRLLEGYRGHPAADLASLSELLLRVSRLADAVPEIVELDLNPVIALPPGQGCRIVDARIRVKRTQSLGAGPDEARSATS